MSRYRHASEDTFPTTYFCWSRNPSIPFPAKGNSSSESKINYYFNEKATTLVSTIPTTFEVKQLQPCLTKNTAPKKKSTRSRKLPIFPTGTWCCAAGASAVSDLFFDIAFSFQREHNFSFYDILCLSRWLSPLEFPHHQFQLF